MSPDLGYSARAAQLLESSSEELQEMRTERANLALGERLGSFRTALRARDLRLVAPFFAPDADVGFPKGIVRGWDEIAATADEHLAMREAADIVSVKWLSRDIALVDGVFDRDDGRGWFTEIWDMSNGQNFLITAARTRIGSPSASFDALTRVSPTVVANEVVASFKQDEEGELRKQFKAFRTAINTGNSIGVANIFTPNCDAIVAFSFLQGRSQILNGRAAVGAKADRMNPGALVSNPAPLESRGADFVGGTADRMSLGAFVSKSPTSESRGANFVGGEPKVIRFLSPTVAVVDGTAEIAGIPRAHGFAPKEMAGVYTDIWIKNGGTWQVAGSRPWF